MSPLLAPETMAPALPRRRDAETKQSAGATAPELLADTRQFDIRADRDIVDELRSKDPRTAQRIDAAEGQMPHPGDEFQGFTLMLELGHGAFGRVFLARQKVLANRLVVLKIAVDLHGESQNLAQLQHTNIVPIYSEHRVGNLHAVCMPYFGSATLADVCRSLSTHQSLPTSGKQVISTLFNRHTTVRENGEPSNPSAKRPFDASRDGALPTPTPRPELYTASANLTKIEEMSYVDVVLWMAARLADGLAHAHERGIIHRDLKPANVLLCDDGQPMLLDFNLAQDTKSQPSFAIAQMGGTPPYMAPEQLIAYRDGDGEVDARGDIYALGLIVYHLLTGRHAFPFRKGLSRDILPKMIADREGPPPGLRCFNRSVSPATEAIVRRCLEPNPARRYQTAAELAEDLERQRTDLPLKHAPEPSYLERASKWARRHPKLTSPASLIALSAALLLGSAALGVSLSLRTQEREQREFQAQSLRQFHDFQADYNVARDLLTTDNPVDITHGLLQGDKALRDYDALERGDWLEQAKVKVLPTDERARLRAQVGEIAFLMATAIYFQPNADSGQALRMNQVAERNLDANVQPIVAQQRAAFKNQPKLDPEVQRQMREQMRQALENAPALNAASRFLLACQHAAEGRHQEALRIVDGVVVENRNDFGAWALKARCHQMLDQDSEAIAAYDTAIALRPTYARAYLGRASVLFAQQTRAEQALKDLDQAINLQPTLLEAHIDRGLVLMRLGRHKEALDDFNAALTRDDVPARVWFIRSRVHKAMKNDAAARLDHETGLRTEPSDHLSWVSRGIAKLANDTAGALADFIKAEEVYPRCVEALSNQAFVYAVKMKKPAEAIAAYDRLLAYFPDNQRALGHRAILVARSGKTEEAVKQGASDLMKLAPKAEHTYRAACALALAFGKDPTLKNECLRCLASALNRGYGQDLLNTDTDLNPMRQAPEFKQFVALQNMMRLWTAPAPKVN